ncbi:MAG: quinone-dependent dihydroorotate dehydrogenase [Patescibacteria group bacterium]
MYKIVKFFLFKFKDPEVPHHFALVFLKFVGKSKTLTRLLKKYTTIPNPKLEQTVFGLTFPNPIGVAAGMDKNGEAILGLESLGFGHIEVGTISGVPQDGNPRPRLFRLVKDLAIINRMGFNSIGSVAVAKNLQKIKAGIPLGISIGKSKIVSLADAPKDYLFSFNNLFEYASYFAINVSSPNTPGLRELQEKNALEELLSKLQTANDTKAKELNTKRKPILVKIAPDLTFPAIKEILEVCDKNNIDGVIAVNTTLERTGLKTIINEKGGLSGLPLKDRATEIIAFIHKEAPNLPIIGVGGVFTAEDAYEKIRAGASLIQVYTSFIYEGPSLAKKLNLGLLELLTRNNKDTLADVRKDIANK